MTVARILREKGREVATTQPHRTLHEAAVQLAEKGIGAVVVSDASRRVLGILSERDVVRAVAQAGADALQQAVSRHMTARVVTVDESASIEHVMETMTNGRFRHIPVVENGALVGIVSIGDIVKRHVGGLHNEREALKQYIASA